MEYAEKVLICAKEMGREGFNPYMNKADAMELAEKLHIDAIWVGDGWDASDDEDRYSAEHPKLQAAIADCAVKMLSGSHGEGAPRGLSVVRI
jgi:alkanesulfonate monooxygenase SsuD/methylene tetrahydromethanopterin reductase-like flavin-dependent oxidoreductase (luciferase family)